MSSTGPRLAVFPTRMNLTIAKAKLKSAEKGHSLLKRKSDALQVKHREISLLLVEKKQKMGEMMEKAFFLLAKAELYGGDMKIAKHEARKAPLRVKLTQENVSGVQLPVYSLVEEADRNLFFIGVSGRMIKECRDMFVACMRMLVEIASLQSSYLILDAVLEATNRRVNALEYLLIPRLENTVHYVSSELSEQEREDFYRLKKVQASKGK